MAGVTASKPRHTLPGRSITRATVVAAAAAVLYGGWAVIANWRAGFHSAVKASLVQATMSFVSTLCTVLILEWLFSLGRTLFQGFLLAAIGTAVLVSIVTLSVHTAAGTPHVLATSAPPISIGSTFGAFYAYRLYTSARASARTAADPA